MKKYVALILIFLLLLSGCAPQAQERHLYAMDTVMTLQLYDGSAEDLDACEQLIGQMEKKFSVTLPQSEISQLNQAGKAALSAESAALLAEGLQISERSGGAFCLSLYPASRLWGFTTEAMRVPAAEELEAVRPLIGDEKITLAGNSVALQAGMALDLGGIAKGYTADRLAALLAEREVKHYFLSLGGNIQVGGGKPDGTPWKIGIADPDGGDPAGIISLEAGAVVTSGGYQRNFTQEGKIYHHILDPQTLAPAQSGLKSVTVVCQSGTEADGLSTALFVRGAKGAEELRRKLGTFEYILITEDDRVIVSAGLKEHFTLYNPRFTYEE